MFYIQTQDGELPYVFKTYKTQTGAHQAVGRFLSENRQDGAISIVEACRHRTVNRFYREDGVITEEVMQNDHIEVVYHGTSVVA